MTRPHAYPRQPSRPGEDRRLAAPRGEARAVHGRETRTLQQAEPGRPGRRLAAALRLFLPVAALLAAACGQDEVGTTDPEANVLQGIVVQAGTEVLLSDVPVTLDTRTTTSTSRGKYRFEDVEVGPATLSASFPGYLPYERRLAIEEGVNDFDIALIPDG